MTNKSIERRPIVWGFFVVFSIVTGAFVRKATESYILYFTLLLFGLLCAYLTYRLALRDKVGGAWDFAHLASLWLAFSGAVAAVSAVGSRLANFIS
jgi:TRAP-type C4-dicarboxylate transport system permease small subunit